MALPTVQFNGGRPSLNTILGNFDVPQQGYDKAQFQQQAAKLFSGTGNSDFKDRYSQWSGSSTGTPLNDYLSQQEIDQISGIGTGSGMDRAFAYKAMDEVNPGRSSQIANAIGAEEQRRAAKNVGFAGKFMRTAVPLALGVGTSLLGGAALAPLLGAGAAAGGGATLSPGALGLASQGSLLPSSIFTTGAAGGFLGGLGSNFAKDAALSGAAKGGVGSLLSGGDFGDALKGAALGGLTGGYGDYLGSSLGLGELGSQTFGGALQGASGGLASGDLKGALIGGLIGGGTDYINAGGNVPGLGTKAGAPLGNGQYGPTQGSGLLGSLTKGLGTSTGGTSMLGSRKDMLGGALKIGGALYNQGQQGDENEDIRRRLMEAQQAAQGQLGDAQAMYDPYSQAGSQAQSQLMAALQAGFNPQDLENDAGYQFRLQQGQQGLDRQMAASGLGQSGAALKAAQEYGQGLASQEYQDAYNRWLSNNQQLAGQAGMGLNAASGQAGLQQGIAGLTSDLGNIDAQVMAANSQNRQKTLADILSGAGQIFGGF